MEIIKWQYSALKRPETTPSWRLITCAMRRLIEIYLVFEAIICSAFSDAKILIENRSGSVYHGGKFVVSRTNEIVELANLIEQKGLNLYITFDVHQLYTARNVNIRKSGLFTSLLKNITPVRNMIAGVHLWGKKKGETGRVNAHKGDFNTYFENEAVIKQQFLKSLHDLFDDDILRNIVLEPV